MVMFSLSLRFSQSKILRKVVHFILLDKFVYFVQAKNPHFIYILRVLRIDSFRNFVKLLLVLGVIPILWYLGGLHGEDIKLIKILRLMGCDYNVSYLGYLAGMETLESWLIL